MKALAEKERPIYLVIKKHLLLGNDRLWVSIKVLNTLNRPNDYLYKNQSVFRSKYSIQTALLDTSSQWLLNIDKGNLNLAVILDLRKAFGTNWVITGLYVGAPAFPDLHY